MNPGILGHCFNSIRFYLTSSQKRKALGIFVLTLIASILEVLGLASIIPVMLLAAEPGGVSRNKYFYSIYNFLGFQSEKSFLLFLIIIIFIFFLLKSLFSTWVNYVQVKFTSEVGIGIIKSQLKKYLNLPFWFFNDFGSANLINSSLTVPNTYVNGIMRPLLVFMSEVAIVAVIVVSILLYKPLLIALLAVVMGPTAYFSYKALRNRSQNIGSTLNKLRPASYAIISDLFTGFVELKLANKQSRFKDKLVHNQAKVQDLDAESYLYSLLPPRMIEIVAIIGVLIIFLYAIYFPGSSGGVIELVGLFGAAAYRLMPSVNRMLTSLVQLKQNQYTIDDLSMYRAPEYDAGVDVPQVDLSFNKEIDFRNVSFTFPGGSWPALNAVNVTIRKGEKIGFIGSSGSGKTTLMNVLLRFYIEQEGGIYIDGVQLTSQNNRAWHNIIGYVKQDTFLMEASIKENITLGDPNADPERMQYAIEKASLQSFIAGLPEGIDTPIGERGSKLSGGQRQRIGIARALYKQTQVLVLDEATSALDNETEREVNEAINNLSQTDMTILIIAHRITTLRECDRIYELNQGRLVAEHQYSHLVEKIIQQP